MSLRWLVAGMVLVGGWAPRAVAAEVTYTKQVAPILWKSCAGCHRPGEVGPFPLLTYKDAAKRADFLKDITASRRMPPWKPEPGFGDFHGARRLSDADIQTIARWVDAGAPEGDPKDLPPQPTFAAGWQLGEPDLVLKVPKPFALPADGPDVFRCFTIPIPIDADQTVAGVEFRAGNPRIVHHAILYLDHMGQGRKKDGADGKPGFDSFGGPGIMPTGGLGAWAPGVMPRMLPEGVGLFVKKGSDLVLQVHYHPDGKAETDQSAVGLYFTKKPAQKIVAGLAMGARDLNIPANAPRYHVTAQSEPLPADTHALNISPHMHLLGREVKVVAETPDGKIIPLIWIKDWDFNWQGTYPFIQPVPLPKGTVFKLDAYYDNSTGNPKNPNNPPRRVTWGEETTDEMCLCSVALLPESMDDLKKIASLRGGRLGAGISGGVLPEDLPGPKRPRIDVKVPPEGIPIPERFKAMLAPYDKDGDGKLSQAEIDAMPAPLRDRVLETYQRMKANEKDGAKKP